MLKKDGFKFYLVKTTKILKKYQGKKSKLN